MEQQNINGGIVNEYQKILQYCKALLKEYEILLNTGVAGLLKENQKKLKEYQKKTEILDYSNECQMTTKGILKYYEYKMEFNNMGVLRTQKEY
eukprot:5564203-Amphidinium_carterae.1